MLDLSREYLSTEEAALIIGRSPTYVAQQCKAGALRATKHGEWRIHPDDLREFMRGGTPIARVREPRRRAS